MTNEFVEIWKRLREDDDVRVIILRAAPSPAFCTGADTKGGPGITPYRTPESRLKPWSLDDPAEALGAKRNKVWKQPIVAVSGMCAGGRFSFLNEAAILIRSEERRVGNDSIGTCTPRCSP